MRKVGIIVTCLVLILLGILYFAFNRKEVEKGLEPKSEFNSESFSSWQEFIPRSQLFKVKLPNTPQYARDLVSIPDSDKKRRYDIYASEKIDGTLFLVSVITYPPDVEGSALEDVLKKTVYEILKSKPDNQLGTLEDSLFKTHSTLNFNINNKTFHVEGKVLIDDKTVYVLSYVTRLNEFDPLEYQYFIDSFELLSKK